MKKQLRELFLTNWRKYFPDAELPITLFYVDEVSEVDLKDSNLERSCIIDNLNRVRQGRPLVLSAELSFCTGGKRYTGFSTKLRANFEYFLSCGIPGSIEGERYKKSPELVKAYLENHPSFNAPGKYLVFKRWDKLSEVDEPQVIIFFAVPDVLSGLFTLANFDFAATDGVITPMGSGCSSIVSYPLEESKSDTPRCVLGMFDVSARPRVPANTLTFAIPIKRFHQMVQNMDESFLITKSWNTVKNRMGQGQT